MKQEIDINLLPADLAPEKAINFGNLTIIALFAVAFICLFSAAQNLMTKSRSLSFQIANVEQQMSLHKSHYQKIKELQGILKEIKNRLSIVGNIAGQGLRRSDMLVDLYYRLPQKGVWLNEIRIQHQSENQKTGSARLAVRKAIAERSGRKGAQTQRQKPTASDSSSQVQETSPIVLYVSGIATSIEKVGELIGNFQGAPFLENVRFTSSEASIIGEQKTVVSFKINALIKSGDATDVHPTAQPSYALTAGQ